MRTFVAAQALQDLGHERMDRLIEGQLTLDVLVFGKQHDRLQLLDATYAAAHTKSMVRRNISDCDEKREAQLGRQAGGRLRAMIFSTTSSIPTAAITKPSSVVIEALLKTP